MQPWFQGSRGFLRPAPVLGQKLSHTNIRSLKIAPITWSVPLHAQQSVRYRLLAWDWGLGFRAWGLGLRVGDVTANM